MIEKIDKRIEDAKIEIGETVEQLNKLKETENILANRLAQLTQLIMELENLKA